MLTEKEGSEKKKKEAQHNLGSVFIYEKQTFADTNELYESVGTHTQA